MNNLILRTAFLATISTAFFSAKAQNDKLWGTWLIANVEYEFAKNFIGYVEFQGRSEKMFNYFFYYEAKGGLTYRINKNFSVFAGFGNYGTYNWKHLDGMKTVDELRIWEQFVYSQSLGRVKVENRVRIEEAWLNKKYRNRFRYRLNLIIPLNKRKFEKGTLFASVFDEVFLTDHAPFFMRNRIYAGVGYQITDFLTVQAGWVNQFNYTLETEGGKNNLVLTVSFRFLKANKNKTEEKPHPTLKD